MRSFVKIALATALVAMLPGAVSAQAELGIRGGLNFATFGGDDADDADSRTALNVGGFVTLPVSSVFGIQIGAGFTSKGAEETEDGTTVSFKLSYIEIPVLAKISVPSTGNVGLHFLAGPAISFRTSCSLDAEGEEDVGLPRRVIGRVGSVAGDEAEGERMARVDDADTAR